MHLFGVNSFFHNKCLCGSPLSNCKWSMYCIISKNGGK
jgi:hypothetical protein